MSVIDRKPFIISVLDSLNADELKTLQSLINGNNGSPIKRSLIYGSTIPLTASDKGIKEANIRISDQVTQQVYEGYLIYNNSYCVLIAYSSEKSQLLSLVDMHLANGVWSYEIRNCELSILELRSELNDRLIEAGAIIPDNVKFTVNDIKALTDAECNDLKVGDMVAKKTGDMYHNYIVTYKEPGQGMCLTYADASVVETQSYDYTAGHWVYNSEDSSSILSHTYINVSVNSWVSDNTYADFPYKAEITCQGITSNSVVEVIFALAQAISGNYAPICESSANKVTIYAKVNTTIVIPTIKEVL